MGRKRRNGIPEGDRLLLELMDKSAPHTPRPGKFKLGDVIEVPGDHHDRNDILY
jgi:hypothetical protein